MSKSKPLPSTLLEAVRHFSDLDVATEFVANLRWPNGPICPRCGCADHSYLSTRRIWKCKGCKKQFSVRLGTIFEDSPLGLDKWLPAIWLAANSKNGVSSHELGRSLGVTQKSAWFMLHRIRLAMQTGSFEKLSGMVEVDETFIGAKARNMHPHLRRQYFGDGGSPTANKATVMGFLERGGKVRAQVVSDRQTETVQRKVRENVLAESVLVTDSHRGYWGLNREYYHAIIDHAESYVEGQIHTNGLENFWSLVKRGLHGTYVSVRPFHLFRYLDERVFTYNLRDLTDYGRFEHVLRTATDRRLTYAELTGHA